MPSYFQKRTLAANVIHNAMLSQHKATLDGDPTKAVKIHDVTDEVLRVLEIQPPKHTFTPGLLNVEITEAGLRSLMQDAMTNKSVAQFESAVDKFIEYVQQTDPDCEGISFETLKLGLVMPLLCQALDMK